MPEGFRVTAHTPVCPIAGMENEEKGWYGIQAHPEVLHTQEGSKMLHNFVYSVCHCAGDWKMDAFVEKSIEEIRKKVGAGNFPAGHLMEDERQCVISAGSAAPADD